jgi:hypothetical protein
MQRVERTGDQHAAHRHVGRATPIGRDGDRAGRTLKQLGQRVGLGGRLGLELLAVQHIERRGIVHAARIGDGPQQQPADQRLLAMPVTRAFDHLQTIDAEPRAAACGDPAAIGAAPRSVGGDRRRAADAEASRRAVGQAHGAVVGRRSHRQGRLARDGLRGRPTQQLGQRCRSVAVGRLQDRARRSGDAMQPEQRLAASAREFKHQLVRRGVDARDQLIEKWVKHGVIVP